MIFMNDKYHLGITSKDLLSLSDPSMLKVSTGVAQFLFHYANVVFATNQVPGATGMDIALSVWRVGIGRTDQNIAAHNFWDYVDPHLKTSTVEYLIKVEGLQ